MRCVRVVAPISRREGVVYVSWFSFVKGKVDGLVRIYRSRATRLRFVLLASFCSAKVWVSIDGSSKTILRKSFEWHSTLTSSHGMRSVSNECFPWVMSCATYELSCSPLWEGVTWHPTKDILGPASPLNTA